jgi:anti-sigma B factor antagonist
MKGHTEITQHMESGVVVLAVAGRLDSSNAGTLEHEMLDLIDGGESRFVVDCAALDYISSAGLRVLLIAAKRLAATAGVIVLSGLTEQIKEVFDIVGFASIFKTYPTPHEAIAALAQTER